MNDIIKSLKSPQKTAGLNDTCICWTATAEFCFVFMEDTAKNRVTQCHISSVYTCGSLDYTYMPWLKQLFFNNQTKIRS